MSASRRAAQARILFVDDDPFYAELASASLVDAGFDVVTAASGSAAVKSLRTASFDLVVLDLGLPDMSGFDVISQIRNELKQVKLPILVITGQDDTASVDRAFDLGVQSFLAKPLNWLLFVHHVNFVLQAARTEAKLRDSMRTTEFMSDLKSRLVGLLVDEFQAPLRHAYGFATLLKKEADGPIDSPLYTHWISDLHTALDKLNTTHAKMLNFGRSLADAISLREEPFDLCEVIATACATSEDLLRRRGITLQCDNRLPQTLTMKGDRVLLDQALRSLVDNSVRFSRRNSEIRLTVERDSEGDITLSILDTSPPLSPAQLDSILGTAQAPQTISRPVPPNTELLTALKLCRVLIEAHQGKLDIRPVGGEDTRTDIRLPAQRIVQGTSSVVPRWPEPSLATVGHGQRRPPPALVVRNS